MAKLTWRVEVEGMHHIVEMKISSFLGFGTGDGYLTLDGNMVVSWGSLFKVAVPSKINFVIQGKQAKLIRPGLFSQNPVLYLDDEEIKRY